MGDPAEEAYQETLPLGKTTRFGFRRPEGMKFSSIPTRIVTGKHFITATYLVEVVGLGADGILKSIKTTKYEALKEWNKFAARMGLLGVAVYVWNSSKRMFLVLPMNVIMEEVKYSKRKHDGPLAFENDGNEYYPLEWDRLTAKAQVVGYHED